MAELTYNAIQTIPAGQSFIFNTSVSCPCGHVLHSNGSSVITLRGIPRRQRTTYASYSVIFKANVALSEGATVGPITVSISNEGEALPVSAAIVTPAAVGDYNVVTCIASIKVPRGCCAHVGVRNTSVGTATNPSIDGQNAILDIIQTD